MQFQCPLFSLVSLIQVCCADRWAWSALTSSSTCSGSIRNDPSSCARLSLACVGQLRGITEPNPFASFPMVYHGTSAAIATAAIIDDLWCRNHLCHHHWQPLTSPPLPLPRGERDSRVTRRQSTPCDLHPVLSTYLLSSPFLSLLIYGLN